MHLTEFKETSFIADSTLVEFNTLPVGSNTTSLDSTPPAKGRLRIYNHIIIPLLFL